MNRRTAEREPGPGGGRRRARNTGVHARSGDADFPATILVVDVGGSNVKMLATGQAEPRKISIRTSAREIGTPLAASKSIILEREDEFSESTQSRRPS